MAFNQHTFTINGDDHTIHVPAGSSAEQALISLIDEHAEMANRPQLIRYLGVGPDGFDRWDIKMADGSIQPHAIKKVTA